MAENHSETPKLPRKVYEKELLRLQTELVVMADWVKREGKRIALVFEGRDAAGKGGVIKRITEYVSPRIARVVALPAPTEREKTQWYFQRYVAHLPAAGEIAIFDRSWYNRAGVEKVMGFCTADEHRRFLHQAPIFERMLVDDGIILIKYWFSVSNEEQERRFKARIEDPLKQWKLSPMDLESISRWVDYSRAKDEMFVHTDNPESPWHVVESDIKRNARINCISHLLNEIPYERGKHRKIKLPKPQSDVGYIRPPRDTNTYVPDAAAKLLGKKGKKKDKR
jgi:polyphosphate kinase 2